VKIVWGSPHHSDRCTDNPEQPSTAGDRDEQVDKLRVFLVCIEHEYSFPAVSAVVQAVAALPGNRMGDEQRGQQRFNLNLQAKMSYSFDELSTKVHICTVAANISCGGAFLKTDQPLPLASRIKVEFQVSRSDLENLRIVVSHDALSRLSDQRRVWVLATGVVIRQEQSGVAVIFDQNYRIRPMQAGETA